LNRLVELGALLVGAGLVLLAWGSAGQGNLSTGGFILIGPLPIVFGSGSNGWKLALLSVLLGGIMILLALFMSWRFRNLTRKGEQETINS